MAQIAGGGATSSGSFMWGGRSWAAGDLGAFQNYLRANGSNYATWAANHPSAAAIFGAPRVATPVNHPTSVSPAAAGGGAGGDAPAPIGPPGTSPAPVDLMSLIANDPLYQQMKGQLGAQDVSDAASRKAAIDRALINWGVVPDSAGLQGLSPDDLAMLKGDIDPATAALAAKNTSEGLSLSSRIAQAHADNLSQLRNSLAARGMLSSGTTGFQTGREDLQNKQASSDALGALLDQINSYIGSYKQGVLGRAGQLGQGASDAANRVRDYLGATNPSPAAVAPATPAPVSPALRVAIPSVLKPKPIVHMAGHGMVE